MTNGYKVQVNDADTKKLQDAFKAQRLENVIERLTTLTNQAKIYSPVRVLNRCDEEKSAAIVFELFNNALTAIHCLKQEIAELKQNDEVQQNKVTEFCDFLIQRAKGIQNV